jgi:hypothetical protein
MRSIQLGQRIRIQKVKENQKTLKFYYVEMDVLKNLGPGSGDKLKQFKKVAYAICRTSECCYSASRLAKYSVVHNIYHRRKY